MYIDSEKTSLQEYIEKILPPELVWEIAKKIPLPEQLSAIRVFPRWKSVVLLKIKKEDLESLDEKSGAKVYAYTIGACFSSEDLLLSLLDKVILSSLESSFGSQMKRKKKSWYWGRSFLEQRLEDILFDSIKKSRYNYVLRIIERNFRFNIITFPDVYLEIIVDRIGAQKLEEIVASSTEYVKNTALPHVVYGFAKNGELEKAQRVSLRLPEESEFHYRDGSLLIDCSREDAHRHMVDGLIKGNKLVEAENIANLYLECRDIIPRLIEIAVGFLKNGDFENTIRLIKSIKFQMEIHRGYIVKTTDKGKYSYEIRRNGFLDNAKKLMQIQFDLANWYLETNQFSAAYNQVELTFFTSLPGPQYKYTEVLEDYSRSKRKLLEKIEEKIKSTTQPN